MNETQTTSKVFFTDFRCRPDEGRTDKLKRLVKAAGIDKIDMDGKFVAIKMHFGELGNLSFLRPNYARAIVDVVKQLGGKPFLTDCNTLYPGSRKNALEHLYCAWENGFTPLTVGCPVIIGDGLKGTDDIEVPVRGGEYVKAAKIGRAVMDADVFISARDDRFRRNNQEHRHGLRLARRQEGAALQRQARHRPGRVPRLPPLHGRVCQRRPRV